MNTKLLQYGKNIFLIIIIYYGIVNYQNLQENTNKANDKYRGYYNLLNFQLKKHNIAIPHFLAPNIVTKQMKTSFMIFSILEIVVSFLFFARFQWKLLLLSMMIIIWIQGLYFIDPKPQDSKAVLMNVEYGCLMGMLLGVCFMTWDEPQPESEKKNKSEQTSENQSKPYIIKKSNQKRM